MDRLTMTVPGKAEYIGTVRIAVAHAAGQAGFDLEAIDDIKVAVSEACTNIVCHAHEGSDYNYEVILEVGEGAFSVTVRDFGAGFDPESYTEPDPGEVRSSGLGIFIIRTLMDEVDIESAPGSGATIHMTKRLRDKIA